MKSILLIPAILLTAAPFSKSFADDGSNLFRTNCGACHSIGKGKLVGPDLKGVDTRHNEEWILKWVKSSQSLVQAGDKDAVKLFADNSSIVMPDQPLKDDEIKTILAYIKAGGEQAATASAATASSESKGPDNITAATQKVAEEKKDSGGSLLTMFSFTEYMLMFLMGILLIVIYVLGVSVKTLTEKVREEKTQASHV